MLSSRRRRNRALASCEPCRKGKIRCDHESPVCASCQRRGLQSRCWYHPAPLTKQSPRSHPTSSSFSTMVPSPTVQSGSAFQSGRRENSSTTTASFHTWPFIFSDPSESTVQLFSPGSYDKIAHYEHLSSTCQMISGLKYLPLIEKNVHRYFSFSQVALVARPIVLQIISSIREYLFVSDYVQEGTDELLVIKNIPQLAEEVIHSSSSEIIITPSLDLPGFCALFSGSNLRVETLGFLYTIAARVFSYTYDSNNNMEVSDDNFMREMTWYSNLGLRVARELAPQPNDILIWLALNNLQLTTLLEGEASLKAWRRVGDLATDIFALGLNREATYSPNAIPFFLSECRRKAFAAAYYLDKVFAMVFNRPPRISIRHADCKAPLDLSDEEIFATTRSPLQEAQKSLGQDGWNLYGGYRTTTWARMRYFIAQFREEIVDCQISSKSPDPLQLRDISKRCNNMWNSFPDHLKYREDCWTSQLPRGVSFMICKVYLPYLQINFQIYRMLGETTRTHLPELIETSTKMLDVVVQLAISRTKTSFPPRDLPGIILSYGLPCASILMTALKNAGHEPAQPLPSGIKASTLIRNLSVLVSHLEIVSIPEESNYTFCIQASKSLAAQLDRILDTPSGLPLQGSSQTQVAYNTRNQVQIDCPFVTPPEDMDYTNIGDLDNFDLASWVIDVDLDETRGEWM